MHTLRYAVHPGPTVRPGPRRVLGAGGVALVVVLALAGCSSDAVNLADLPAGVASARPSITADEGAFALAAVRRDAALVPLAPERPEGRAPRRPMFRGRVATHRGTSRFETA